MYIIQYIVLKALKNYKYRHITSLRLFIVQIEIHRVFLDNMDYVDICKYIKPCLYNCECSCNSLKASYLCFLYYIRSWHN